MAILDKINSTISRNKLHKEISDLENKKASLQRAVMNEINGINVNIGQICTEIGRDVYEYYSTSGEVTMLEDFGIKFEKISSLKKTIAEKEAKLTDITNRYDEELGLLKNLVLQESSVNFAGGVPSSGAFCRTCNAAYKPGVDVFCGSCGSKTADSAPVVSAAPAAALTVCGSCGAPYQVGVDVFCGGCGNKL